MAGGEGGCHSNRFLQFFSRMGKDFISNKSFSCSLILRTSVYQNIFQIGPTILALELDKGRVLGGGGGQPAPMDFFTYFSNYEDDIQS